MVFGIGAFFAEYGVQFGIGAALVGSVAAVFIGGGCIALGLYSIFWILEITGLLDDNPIEYFLTHVLVEWYQTLSVMEFVRVPLIYFEYMATLFLTSEENPVKDFDPTNSDFQLLFFLLGFPFIYNFIFLLQPFLLIFMPIFTIWYFVDPTYFERDVMIFTDTVEEDTGIKKEAAAGAAKTSGEREKTKISVA